MLSRPSLDDAGESSELPSAQPSDRAGVFQASTADPMPDDASSTGSCPAPEVPEDAADVKDGHHAEQQAAAPRTGEPANDATPLHRPASPVSASDLGQEGIGKEGSSVLHKAAYPNVISGSDSPRAHTRIAATSSAADSPRHCASDALSEIEPHTSLAQHATSEQTNDAPQPPAESAVVSRISTTAAQQQADGQPQAMAPGATEREEGRLALDPDAAALHARFRPKAPVAEPVAGSAAGAGAAVSTGAANSINEPMGAVAGSTAAAGSTDAPAAEPAVRVAVSAATSVNATGALVQVCCTVSDSADHTAEAAGEPRAQNSHEPHRETSVEEGTLPPQAATSGAGSAGSAVGDDPVSPGDGGHATPSRGAGDAGGFGAGVEAAAGAAPSQEASEAVDVDGTGVGGVDALLSPQAGEVVHQFTDALSSQLGGWLWGSSAAGDSSTSPQKRATADSVTAAEDVDASVGALPRHAAEGHSPSALGVGNMPGSGRGEAAPVGEVASADVVARVGTEGATGEYEAGPRRPAHESSRARRDEAAALREVVAAREEQLASQAQQLAEMQAAMGALQVCFLTGRASARCQARHHAAAFVGDWQ